MKKIERFRSISYSNERALQKIFAYAIFRNGNLVAKIHHRISRDGVNRVDVYNRMIHTDDFKLTQQRHAGPDYNNATRECFESVIIHAHHIKNWAEWQSELASVGYVVHQIL